MTILSRLLAALTVAALCCGAAASRGDETKQPYQIRVVLDVARHRLLTDVFRQRLAEALGDGIQAALGEMAEVKVTHEHESLAAIRARGLGRALDAYRVRSPFKYLFVRVDFTGGEYRVQTRQYDGEAGVASPAVREDRTNDRAFVGRVAALLLERDLGLLGTVQSEPDGDRLVRVALKGGALGTDLKRWVKKGEVFALVRGDAGEVVPFAYLQVHDEPTKAGTCTGKLYSRYRLTRVSGLRCVLLGARPGPLRLRLVQEEADGRHGRLKEPMTVEFRREGFDGEDTTKLKATSDGSRDLDTAKLGGPFDRLAFVSILSAGKLRTRMPIAVVDSGVVVVPVPAGDAEQDETVQRVRELEQSVQDAYQLQADMFKDINALTAQLEKRTEALARVKQTLKRLREDHARLSAEQAEVQKEIDKLPEGKRPNLAGVTRRLRQISAGETELLNQVATLEKIEKEENDPRRKEWRILEQRARGLEKKAEVGQALEIYKKAPAEFVTPALKKHVAELEKRWRPRDEEHQKARHFTYKVYPTLTTADLAERVKDAQKALGDFKRTDDVYGLVKLHQVTDAHRQRMEEEAKRLRPDRNEEDIKPSERILVLRKQMARLDEEIRLRLERDE